MQSIPFKIIGVDHIGLAPKSADRLKKLFSSGFGFTKSHEETVETQKTLTSFFSISQSSPNLEILEDNPKGEGPIAKFLATKGSGIHHIAIQVDKLELAIKWLKDQDFNFVSTDYQKGAHNSKIVFLHPKSTGGILIELIEKDK